MAIKSNLIESSRASLCCVGAACNPETSDVGILHYRPTYGIPYSIWIADWEVGRLNDPGTIFEGEAYFKLYGFLRLGKGDGLYLREVWYTILLRAIWPIRQFTKGPSKLLKWERILPSTHFLRVFPILQCLIDCPAIYGAIVVAVVVNNI